MIIMDNNDNDNGNRNKEIHGVIKPGCTLYSCNHSRPPCVIK